MHDLRFAFRQLIKSPSFTAIAVIALALGIGANTAMFSVVNAILLRPLPFPQSDRLTVIWQTNPEVTKMGFPLAPTSVPDFKDWRAQAKSFEAVSAIEGWSTNLTGVAEAERLDGARVSANLFSLLRVQPILGRAFVAGEDERGRNQVVILSYELWQRRFGGDRSIIGRKLTLDQEPYTVVGVMARGFDFPSDTGMPAYMTFGPRAEVWAPFAPSEGREKNRGAHNLAVIGRLKPSVSLTTAQAEMNTLAARFAQQYPDSNKDWGIQLVSLQKQAAAGSERTLSVLMAAVGCILLIACANVANLMLTRSAGRQREIAIRSALGARRARLMRQLLTESILLGLLGGALGLLLAHGAIRLLPLLLPATGSIGEIPHASGLGINLPVLAFTFAVAILTGIIFGLAPAFQSSQTDLTESLKESGRGSSAGRQSRATKNSLVVVEIAMSLVLLVGAGTLLRGLSALLNANLGFNPENVLSFQVWLPDSHYTTPADVRGFFQEAISKLRAIPGVKFAGAINFLPLTGWTDLSNFDISGRPAPPPKEEFVAHYRAIDPGYFTAMQIPLLSGRDFMAGDGENAQPVAIISKALAQKYWPNENPIGQQIRLRLQPSKSAPYRPVVGNGWATIVGVVSNLQEREFAERQLPIVYFPIAQVPSRIMWFVLRTSVPPDSLASSARQAVFSVDKNQPVTEMKSLHELRSETVSREELNAKLLTFFALLALVLAAIGIYGVICYGVEQRTHEIGIRMALGARPGDVVRLIVREGSRLILLGVLLGMIGAYALTNVLAGFLFGVKSIDLPSILLGIAVLVIFALLACYVPARRATRIDPLNSLRYE